MAEALRDDNFDFFIAESDKPVLADFYNDGCVPCRRVAPLLSRAEKKYEGRVNFVKVNIAMNPEAVRKYEVAAAPTLLVLKDGKEAGRHRGAANAEQIEALIENILKGSN